MEKGTESGGGVEKLNKNNRQKHNEEISTH